MEPEPTVIAVSAIAGGGKTAFVTAAARELDAAVLMFDHYTTLEDYPPDFAKWLRDGADFNEWKSPQFASDLKKLISWQSVESRHDGSTIEPKPVIILEEATGRQRSEMADLIDFVVVIDTPLEIGLARLVKRSLGDATYLSGYLEFYLAIGPPVYSEIRNQVMGNCDLILDWQLPIEKQIQIMSDEFGLEGAVAKPGGTDATVE